MICFLLQCAALWAISLSFDLLFKIKLFKILRSCSEMALFLPPRGGRWMHVAVTPLILRHVTKRNNLFIFLFSVAVLVLFRCTVFLAFWRVRSDQKLALFIGDVLIIFR